MDALINEEKQYVAQNYAPLPVVLAKGEGIYVWDTGGKRYIDCLSAYSALSHGHCHPKLLQVLTKQAQQMTLASRGFYTDKLAPFAKRLCELSGLPQALPMNTGAEAVETSIKAARKWGYTVKDIPGNQAEIIVCDNNFHGRTTTIVSFSTEAQYREHFGPLTPGFTSIPFGDADALEAAINDNTAAFLVEPIQGEGGIIVPPGGYLKRCAEICAKHNVLLLCDEIQTGLGRTGKLFAFEHEGIQPDGLMLGKALGGGILPVSVFLARQDVMDVFTPGDHGSTFGGNPLACAIGLKAVNLLFEENLIEQSKALGTYLMQQLQTLRSSAIREVRGKGLLIGIDIDPTKADAHTLCLKLMTLGILAKDTHGTVIRLAPPLTITQAQLDTVIQALRDVLPK